MSLKQVVKYMFNTDPDKINADIAEYKMLRDAYKASKRTKESAHLRIMSLSGADNANHNGCKVVRYADLSADTNESKMIVGKCEMFDYESVCKNEDCEYFQANKEYILAWAKYNKMRGIYRGFWAKKINNVK